eukprot:gene582-627_t
MSTTVTTTSINKKTESVVLDEDYRLRFQNLAYLYGGEVETVLTRLRQSHVCVVGLGGVGSWIVEALARSGIGHLTLIDMDDVCLSNINRQLVGQTSTIGKLKTEVLEERIHEINPSAIVYPVCDFLRPHNIETLLTTEVVESLDYLVDATDGVSDKAAILAFCAARGLPVMTTGGVGGLVDPSLITLSDLSITRGDHLLMRVKKKLRQDYGFPKVMDAAISSNDEVKDDAGNSRPLSLEEQEEVDGAIDVDGEKASSKKVVGKIKKKKWQILAVHTLPTGQRRDGTTKSPRSTKNSRSSGQSCSLSTAATSRPSSFRACDGFLGNACFLTGTVGFMMAGQVVTAIATDKCIPPRIAGISPAIVEQARVAATSQQQQPSVAIEEKNITTSSIEALDTFLNDYPLSEQVFDAHCHLQLDRLYDEIDLVVDHLKRQNITQCSVCATSPDDWNRLEDLASTYPDRIIANFGLHPWWISQHFQAMEGDKKEEEKKSDAKTISDYEALLGRQDITSSWVSLLERMLTRNPKAGVGECGIDRNIKQTVSMDLQIHILKQHLEVAGRFGRPVSIHCVSGCWGHLLDCLTSYYTEPSAVQKQLPSAVILHSCNSLPADMVPAFNKIPNLYYSLSAGIVNNAKQLKLVKHLPKDRLLLESDSPDQLPRDIKSKQPGLQVNAPSIVRYACHSLLEETNCASAEELARLSYANAARAFSCHT